MNNTADIDLSLYACYYSIETHSPFTLWIRHPDGDVLYDNYDLFTTEYHTIIAFKQFSLSKTEYNYVIKFDNHEEIIQWALYEHLWEHVNSYANTEDGVYVILNSVSMPNLMATNFNPILPFENRCDTNSYGVKTYSILDNVKTQSINPETVNVNTIKFTLPLLNSVGDAHIVFMKIAGQGVDYRDWPGVTRMSKSLVGVLKLLVEWASLKEEPFNSDEEIVLDCVELIKKLDMSKTVIDELIDTQEDMPLYRYLKGMDNARTDFVDNPVAGPLLLSWIKSKARYRSLNAMIANMDSPPHIASSVLNAERDNIERSIISYCLVNDIDPEGVDANDLINTISEPTKMSDKANREIREHLFSYRAYA